MTKILTRRTSGITRRKFIGTVASTAAFTIVPRHVLGGTGYAAPSETLNLALVGAGGHGAFLINEGHSQSVATKNTVDTEKAFATIVPLPVYLCQNPKLNNDLGAAVSKTHLINQNPINSWALS